MTRLVVPFILLLLMLFAGAVWAFLGFDLPSLPEAPSIETPQASMDASKQKPVASSDESYSVEGGTASFDIARVDPNGTSVFAGRAEPGSQVTITGDGETVGTTEADANGEWTFAGEHKFTSADPKLGLHVTSAAAAKEQKAAAAKVASARADADLNAGKKQSASAVTTHLLKNLEGLVDEARSQQGREAPALEAQPGAAAKEVAPAAGNVATAHLEPSAPPVREEPQSKSIPVPVTFVYDEATLTGAGRKAADLLLEYLKLKHYPKVTLTGHADERGTEALNMSLSRERLETVERLLREGGYNGKLELIPKGESEPFLGVDRSQYSQDDLWQLDRRVELDISP